MKKRLCVYYDLMPAVLDLDDGVPLLGYVLVEGEWTDINAAELWANGRNQVEGEPGDVFPNAPPFPYGKWE